MPREQPRPVYFSSPSAFRAWLRKNHATRDVLWVGYYKRGTGRPSLTWEESVDQALCYGWIDGVRKSVDADRYTVRFTPRKPDSTWSAVNMRRVRSLLRRGLMRRPGLRAYEARDPKKTERYSFEHQRVTMPPSVRKVFQSDPKAWAFFLAQPPGYRKTATWWVVSAKRDETRRSRLRTLITDSRAGRRIRLLSPGRPSGRRTRR